jgi:hypothetical protein
LQRGKSQQQGQIDALAAFEEKQPGHGNDADYDTGQRKTRQKPAPPSEKLILRLDGTGVPAWLPDTLKMAQPAIHRGRFVPVLAIQRKASVPTVEENRRLGLIASELAIKCQ